MPLPFVKRIGAVREVRRLLNMRFSGEGLYQAVEALCEDYESLEREANKQAQRIDELEAQLLHQDA